MSWSVLTLGVVALGLLIPLAVIIGGFVVVVKLIGGSRSGSDRREQAEETQMIQDMHRSLSRMEGRVEAMETILADAPAAAREPDHESGD